MTPDILPWLSVATQYSGLATVIIGVGLLAQNWVQTTRTRAKFTQEIAAVERRFNAKIDEAERREDLRHETLESKQEEILKAVADKLQKLELASAHLETAHVTALGKLAERMARVEAEVHALRS